MTRSLSARVAQLEENVRALMDLHQEELCKCGHYWWEHASQRPQTWKCSEPDCDCPGWKPLGFRFRHPKKRRKTR